MGDRLESMETVFKALADRTRLRILGLLLTGEVCVCDIYESLKIPQPKASRHLAYLKRAGLVETRRQGLWVYYRLAAPSDEVLQTLVSAVTHCLKHLAVVGRDHDRLKRKTGAARPLDLRAVPVFACCAGKRCDVSVEVQG